MPVRSSVPRCVRTFAAIVPALMMLALAATPVAAATTEDIPFGQGVLFKIERNGVRPSYVLGTFHVNDERVTTLPEPVAEAFASTRSLTLEIVMGADVSARLSRYLLGGRGRSVEALVGGKDLERLIEVGAKYGLKGWEVRLIKARVFWWLLEHLPAERNVETGDESDEAEQSEDAIEEEKAPFLDYSLQLTAIQRGARVYGLETLEEQFSIFDRLSEEEQGLMLAVAGWNWKGEPGDMEPMLKIYLARDIATLYADMQEAIDADSTGATARYYELMIDVRNRNMVVRMLDRLQDGNAFVAVGALHLPGEKGVLRLLEKYGFQVSRVY
jgi:hypothetical protein